MVSFLIIAILVIVYHYPTILICNYLMNNYIANIRHVYILFDEESKHIFCPI